MVVLLTLFVGIEYVGCELEPEPEPDPDPVAETAIHGITVS
jgi:hypothetical protein